MFILFCLRCFHCRKACVYAVSGELFEIHALYTCIVFIAVRSKKKRTASNRDANMTYQSVVYSSDIPYYSHLNDITPGSRNDVDSHRYQTVPVVANNVRT